MSSICPEWFEISQLIIIMQKSRPIGSFIFENMMDAVIIPENVSEPLCFPTAINNGMKKQSLYSNTLK